MALLELLAGAAPAWVVAADLLALVDVPPLDVHGHRELLVIAVGRGLGDLAWHDARSRGGERARLRLGGPALVLEPRRLARAGLRRGELLRLPVRPLDLDLDVEDVARELLPDRVDQRAEHLEAL